MAASHVSNKRLQSEINGLINGFLVELVVYLFAC